MNRRSLAAFIFCCSLCAGVQGAEQPLVTMGSKQVFTPDDLVLADRLQERAASYGKELNMAVPQTGKFNTQAEQIRQNMQLKLQQELASQQGGMWGNADFSKAQFDTLIFASFSLPRQALETMYKAAAGSERTAIVFRGLPPGCRTINAAIRKIQELAVSMDLQTPPNVLINPVWFKQYQISTVPTILALDEKTASQSGNPQTGKAQPAPKVLAAVRGLLDPAWLYQRLSEGHSGDLGVQGPLEDLAERDLIEEMIARAGQIDWQQKKEAALSRVWTNLPIEELTPAQQGRKRLVDPTFTVNQDLTLPDGTMLARKGERINPLDRRQFDRLLVVFDGSSQREIAYVKAHLDKWRTEAKIAPQRVRLILTGIDRERGWDSYQSLMNFFDDEIFVLTPEVKQSFALEHHPCIVYADGRTFTVEEFSIDED